MVLLLGCGEDSVMEMFLLFGLIASDAYTEEIVVLGVGGVVAPA